MKKTLTLIVCVCLALTVFTACGAQPQTPAPAASAQPQAAAAETPAAEPVQPIISNVEPASEIVRANVTDSDMTASYTSIEVTGKALEMALIFSRSELENLAGYGLEYADLNGLTVTADCDGKQVTGLDLTKFLELCGYDTAEQQVTFIGADSKATISFNSKTVGVVVLSVDGVAVDGVDVAVGLDYVSNVRKIMTGSCCSDPHFEMHNRAPHDLSADIEFTFNIYKGDELEKTVVYTTAQLEQLALENSDAVNGSYYGVIGSLESIPTMGGGGFLDYYEGLRFDWLLTQELGLTLEGRAELFSRDGEMYAEIENLQYFAQPADSYYSCTADGAAIWGMAVPTLAYSKNGAPLLPQHEHDVDGYISSNIVKSALKDMGVDPVELGTVKNHSGPFVAALGNCTGYYGGYQMETAADCVRMDIYLK